MRLYIVTDEADNVLAWAGSQSDAKKAKKERPAATDWREQEVPTSKEDLLTFLNDHFVTRTGSGE